MMTITSCKSVHDGGKKLVYVAFCKVRVDDLDDRIDYQFGWEASKARMYWASSSMMPRKMNWALQSLTQVVGDLSMKSGRSRYDDDDKVSAAVAACLLLLSPMLADNDDEDGAAKE